MENIEDKFITPEVGDRINKLFSLILAEQQKHVGLSEPDKDKMHLIKNHLEDFSSNRGAHFFFQYISSGKGHGPFTELIDGSRKYDLIGAIGPNLLGHSHPLYIKAHLESACNDVIMCGNLLTYPESINLTKLLIDQVKEKSKLRHFWYSCSGSAANDVALKLIWQRTAPRYRIIAFEKSFAGRSVATQNITYNESYRENMPKSIQVDHVPYYDSTDPKNASNKTIKAIKEAVKANPRQHCAIILELIQGEAGFMSAPKEYYQKLLKWCKEQNFYIWIDEIQTFARTKELFAFQMLELDKYVDVVTVGKSLQACGTLYTKELKPKPGLIAGTFNGSLVALNAGEKIVRYLTEGNFYGKIGRIAELEDIFISRFTHLMKDSCKRKITYVGGSGTMISFEVGDSSKKVAMEVVHELFRRGVISFIAGENPTRIRFLLPLSLKGEHIDEIFIIIRESVLAIVK